MTTWEEMLPAQYGVTPYSFQAYLSKAEKVLIDMYYNRRLPLAAVGRQLGVSYQSVTRLKQRLEKKLSNFWYYSHEFDEMGWWFNYLHGAGLPVNEQSMRCWLALPVQLLSRAHAGLITSTDILTVNNVINYEVRLDD